MTEQTQERTRMTAAEFFQLPESNLPTELIDGDLIMSPAPIPGHQTLVFELGKLVDRLKKGGRVYLSPIDVYLDDLNIVQPDVLWVAPDSACVVTEKHLRGAPDLVIEVLLPSTSTRDRREKFGLYETHGVREYWLVDPLAQHIEVWQREGDSFKRPDPGIYTAGESFDSLALAQAVTLKNLFETEDDTQTKSDE